MSQYATPTDYDAAPPLVTSKLAIAALVCAIIVVCPPIPLIGALLGLIALFTVGERAGTKGKGLAFVAVVIGLIATAAAGIVIYFVVDMGMKFVEQAQARPNEVLTAGFSGDIDGFLAGVDNPQADADSAMAFLTTLETRYGEFIECRWDMQNNQSQTRPGQPRVTMPYFLEFDQKTLNADIELVFDETATSPMAVMENMKLGSIMVYDPENGDLRFPPAGSQ
jgi:hypothetical protein